MKECLVCKRIYGDAANRCQRDHSPLKPTLPGPLLVAERYRVEEKIVQGSMGYVYRGCDIATEQPVAIKMISPEYVLADAETEAIFFELAEKMLPAHPRIVKVHTYGKNLSQSLYLVMEFIVGYSFKTLIEQEPQLKLDRAIELMAQLCAAIAEVHRRGLLYGQLKPSDVMITYNELGAEEVKLLDCGFSFMKTSQLCCALPPPLANRLLEMPYYMAPEICNGDEGDMRSEVYSLGALCYHLLAASPPFNGETSIQIMEKHINGEYPPLKQLRNDIPEAVETLIKRALEKDPQARFPSPATFASLLKMCLLEASG